MNEIWTMRIRWFKIEFSFFFSWFFNNFWLIKEYKKENSVNKTCSTIFAKTNGRLATYPLHTLYCVKSCVFNDVRGKQSNARSECWSFNSHRAGYVFVRWSIRSMRIAHVFWLQEFWSDDLIWSQFLKSIFLFRS